MARVSRRGVASDFPRHGEQWLRPISKNRPGLIDVSEEQCIKPIDCRLHERSVD